MNADKVFFDTNVVLYLLSADTAKADKAEYLLEQGGVVSVQVLNEFASVTRRKLGKTWDEVAEMLNILKATCKVELVSLSTHDRALLLARRYNYSLYDSLILAAALLANCSVVYSEDMQHDQVINGRLRIRNPFEIGN